MFRQKFRNAGRTFVFIAISIALMFTSFGGTSKAEAGSTRNSPQAATINDAVVFVSRQIPGNGSVYYPQGGSMPGVQPYSRFQVAAPGKLIVREANGSLRVLVDGSNPTAASLNLIDVNAPDVSYDATKIVFAGLPSGNYYTGPVSSPGAWRIYVINVNGTGLRQVTFSDRNINLSQFGSVASNFTKYDDTDPVWLPDGRIVFSSTRWPSFGQYGAALTSNLYVVNADGSNLHRITAERNGAERPVIDPLTGRIVYSRWWRNFRLGTNNMATMPYSEGGYIMKDGICALKFQGAECQEAGGLTNLERNAWHLAAINPDGTGLAQFAGRSNSFFVGESVNHAYGGAFAPDGAFYANFFPMTNGTEAAGFGGIRRYQRGPNGYTHIIGITNRDESVQQFVRTNPTSYGVFVGNYAADPAVLPDGRLVISWAQDTRQDYGLYIIDANGGNRTLLYDNPGSTELRARLIRPRPLPPVIPDSVTRVASALPPTAQGPYDIDGTFTFNALNVYFNAPVDWDILSAPPVGSANTIRFFADFQRDQQRGSFEYLDWPILLKEMPVNPDGSISTSAPANIPLFEQLRTSPEKGYTIPLTGRGVSPDEMGSAAHVAGMNFGRTGEVATCVGCHAGHTMIPVPANPLDAQWTNLAPGATVAYSSLHSSLRNGNGAVDRKVKLRMAYNNHYRFWLSREGQNPNTQWLQLTFPVPITVRTVRLYDMPASESNVNVNNTTVRLYSDAAGTNQVANKTSGALSENGTNVAFSDVRARVVRIEFTSVSGSTAGLAEVEVIARAEADIPFINITGNAGAPGVKLSYPSGEVISHQDGSYLISVPNGWSGTVTPSHPCYIFTPAFREYNIGLITNQTGQNYTAIFNTSAGCANINLTIGGSSLGNFGLPPSKGVQMSYAGVDNGPVKVTSTNGVPIVAGMRAIWLKNGQFNSYSELMGLPKEQLSTEYWFPW
ncbi:MAG: PD40 domain-containing protein, partial [Anaerolineales bacterium]|nr:PD40 domain-containing protein [Anaerolineales bacterium]